MREHNSWILASLEDGTQRFYLIQEVCAIQVSLDQNRMFDTLHTVG